MPRHRPPPSARPSLADKVAAAADSAREARFEARVARLCRRLLGRCHRRDPAVALAHLKTVVAQLSGQLHGVWALGHGSTLTADPIVTGLADVDALLVLDGYETSMRPSYVRNDLARTLGKRLPDTCTLQDTGFTLAVGFADGHRLQLLPAIVLANGAVRLASCRDAGQWSGVDPLRFREAFSDAQHVCAEALVPMLKLAKLVNHSQPEDQRLSGYHLEGLAITIFRSHAGATTLSAMLRAFFAAAPALVLQPLCWANGAPMRLDSHLGAADSADRRTLAVALQRIDRAFARAVAARSLRHLRLLVQA